MGSRAAGAPITKWRRPQVEQVPIPPLLPAPYDAPLRQAPMLAKAPTMLALDSNPRLRRFVDALSELRIAWTAPAGGRPPPHAALHDRGAIVPRVIVSPRSEWGVAAALRALHANGLYGDVPVSVKSGGHGYHNGATCDGIMIDLSRMTQHRIEGGVMVLGPGCPLSQTVHLLAQHGKSVPHGDCFAVCAGGHFTTAGWDLLLSRQYGLGCQWLAGARLVQWDGAAIDVDETTPDLLWAMRGGAAASLGVVTELRIRVFDAPKRVSWRFTPITRAELARGVERGTFARGTKLPRDVSMSFRFHFDPAHEGRWCSFNFFSLRSPKDTIACLHDHLGEDVAGLVSDAAAWTEGSLLDSRLIPASEMVRTNPGILGEVTSEDMREAPLRYWQPPSTLREMASSYFATVSNWVVPDADPLLLRLHDIFEDVANHPSRSRIYALVTTGGGRMRELPCAMPIGEALARFEAHWDEPGPDEAWSRALTERVYESILQSRDPEPGRPYRGDIWLSAQGDDPRLDAIRAKHDRRAPCSPLGNGV